MSFTHVTAESEDGTLDVVMADAMRFDDNGRVVEFWTLSNDEGRSTSSTVEDTSWEGRARGTCQPGLPAHDSG
jgi:hypothetical protein